MQGRQWSTGTVLRRVSAAGDYDIDLACRLDIDKESFS